MSSSRFRSLPRLMRAYVAIVVAVGIVTIAQSVFDLVANPRGWAWTILALLTLVSGSATVRLPSLPATISISETFVFTSVLLFGPAAGTITVALDALIISFWSHKKGDPLYKIVFNVSALPLTIWLAAHIFFLAAGIRPLASHSEPVAIRDLLLPVFLLGGSYFLLNSWIIALAISLEKRLRPFNIWRENFVWLSLNYFGGASVAALVVNFTRDLEFTYLAVIIPLLVMIYFTFSMSMGRVEDANAHLRQLNSLYMSTIETLAMAIDAKDQITHGHIRRVQAYAVTLAKEMGVSDEKLIRAIEAAALLHDMGKLAVPEHILNKPGPLTPAEFERMKLHASVGADILSAIDFPYPVVPIVRHHHESWNGSGYPAGLSGSEIPIGARILSVVDCFDALTSDRPYRPRLSDRDALRILEDRRGTMYDPLVVDTFIRIHPHLNDPTAETSIGPHQLESIAAASSSPQIAQSATGAQFEQIAASRAETMVLLELAQQLGVASGPEAVADVTLHHVRRLIPASLALVFVRADDSDDLRVLATLGDNAALASQLSVRLGQKLSGWVGANRQTIRNSDAILDFGEAARAMARRPRSAMATAIVGSDLVGVLSVYSTLKDAFTLDQARVLEAIAGHVAKPLEAALSAGREEPRKPSDSATSFAHPSAVIFVQVEGGTTPHQNLTAEHEAELLSLLRQCIRPSDVVFRIGSGAFVVVLADATTEAAADAVRRIQAATQRWLRTPLGQGFSRVRATFAISPEDGHSPDILLKIAKLRAFGEDDDIGSPNAPPSVH